MTYVGIPTNDRTHDMPTEHDMQLMTCAPTLSRYTQQVLATLHHANATGTRLSRVCCMSMVFTKHKVLTSSVVVHGCLGKHGIVLNLCLPDRRAVVADKNQLSCNTQYK